VFSTLKLDWQNALFSYLFLLSRTSNGSFNTVLVTGWSLCYEMYFYALFALLLFLPRRMFLLAGGVIFAAGLTIDAAGIEIAPWATVATNPLLLEFYLGTIIAFLFIRGYYLPPALALIGIVAGIAAIVIISYPGGSEWMLRVLCWGAPAAIILASAISLERNGLRVPRVLVSLGESSYSLYLVHIFIVTGVAIAWAYCGLTAMVPFYVLGLASFVAALSVSHLVHLWMERPLNSLLKPLKTPARDACATPRLAGKSGSQMDMVTNDGRFASGVSGNPIAAGGSATTET